MHKIYEWFNGLVNFGLPLDGETKFFFWFCVAVVLFILGVIAWGIYSLIDSLKSYEQEFHGIILDKSHKEAESSSGMGIGPTSNGGVAMVVTSSSSPESWNFIIRENRSRGVIKISATMQEVYDTPIGSAVIFVTRFGGLSKSVLDYRIESINGK